MAAWLLLLISMAHAGQRTAPVRMGPSLSLPAIGSISLPKIDSGLSLPHLPDIKLGVPNVEIPRAQSQAQAPVLPMQAMAAAALEPKAVEAVLQASAPGGATPQNVQLAAGALNQIYDDSITPRKADVSVPVLMAGTPSKGGRLAKAVRRVKAGVYGVVRSLRPLKELPPDERKLVRLGFAWHFVTIAAYTIVGAVKNGMLLFKFGAAALPWVYMASAAATGLAVWGFNAYAKRVPRAKLIAGAIVALSVSLGGWAALVFFAPSNPYVSLAFSLFADVFGIMSVTLFWSYAADIFTTESAKRVYGLVGSAGPLGSILGAALTMVGAVSLGLSPLLAIAAVLYFASLFLFRAMEKLPHPKPVVKAEPEPKPILKTIMASPFLVFLSAVVILERLVPDFSNYLFSAVARQHYLTSETLAQFSGFYSVVQGVVSLVASVFLTRVVLKRLGVGAALASAPIANLVGFLVFPFHSTLGWASGYNGAEGMLRYTWFKAAKEATYTAESRDVIYRVKAFIEMFLYRFARGLAGLLLLVVVPFGLQGVAYAGIPLAILWLYSAWRMSREFKKASTPE